MADNSILKQEFVQYSKKKHQEKLCDCHKLDKITTLSYTSLHEGKLRQRVETASVGGHSRMDSDVSRHLRSHCLGRAQGG